MKVRFLLPLLLLANSCTPVTKESVRVRVPEPSPTIAQLVDENVSPDIPKSIPDFHESLDEIVADGQLGRLRDVPIADNDIELRVWGGFGLTGIDLFILRRTNSMWTSTKIKHVSNGESQPNKRRLRVDKVELDQPAIGWDAAWQLLLRSRLLTLPDAKSIKCEAMYDDGYSYVVEVRKGRNYRTYAYDNPDADFENRCNEADEILAIARLITDHYSGL